MAVGVVAGFFALTAFAQVQTVGDVSFSRLDGWQYQQGPDYGAMTVKSDSRFWLLAVYTSTPSTGDANADFKAAWRRVLSPMGYPLPGYNPYNMSQTAGYRGKYYEGANSNKSTYARLYVLDTGKSSVPVVFVSQNRGTLDGMEHNALALAGSVRAAPLKASPIKFSITVADLAGSWTNGIVTSIDYYNSAGQYQSNSLTAVRYTYNIAADGSYSYSLGGMLNNRATSDDDTGVVQLGEGFVTFKGRKRLNRYRFVNLQQALDGSSVLALWPDADPAKIDSSHDTSYLTRTARK